MEILKMAYKYYVSENKVVCLSTFAKRPVRGIAKYDPNNDTFNEEAGKKLSRLRCDVKIYVKRKNRAEMKLAEAQEALRAAQARVIKMENYLQDSTQQLADAQKELADYEASL
jgi:hypothetical protein